MRKKLKLPIPIIVEGRYDKIKLSGILDANIICTDGFGIFSKKEKLSLIKRLSENGVVLLCDSDGAGGVIRSHIMSALPKEKIYNLYIPKIKGKEKRKSVPSKEGTLGVEGMDADMLYGMFENLFKNLPENGKSMKVGGITKADFFEFGMTGREESKDRREQVAKKFGLPDNMTPNALLGALNMLASKEEFISIVGEIFDGKN